MHKNEIIDLIESHRLKLDLDRWDTRGWMRFEVYESELVNNVKPLIVWKDDINETAVKTLCRRCVDYWFMLGKIYKQNEIKGVLNISNGRDS